MNEPRDNPTPSRTVVSILGAFLLLGGALLGAGGKDYPDLHMMLDTSVFLLSGLLGLLLWQIGLRSSNPFPKWIAISFAVTSLSEFVHAFVSVEWSGRFVSIVHVQQVLRPATWPPAAYLLPIGVGGALWLMRRGRQRTMGFGLALAVLTVALFAVFRWLPRYAPTSWLGIARPSLILVPLLWAMAARACWRLRASDRMLPMLA